jgi:hypothetical protein
MSDPIHLDAFNLLCGELLGTGVHRKVFECRLRPELVVKVEYDLDNRFFANVFEQKFWSDASPAVAAWLAPCEYLSSDARLLLQRRCHPLSPTMSLPELVPAFLTDLKRENFGEYDGRLVCMDYALVNLQASMKMKKAHWT